MSCPSMEEGKSGCMNSWVFMTLTTISTFVLLLVLVRWIGSTQLSQLTFFNWVAGACMGNLGANMVTAHDLSHLASTSYELTLFAASTVVSAFIVLKNRRLRRLGNGEPVVLVHKGILLRQNLRQTKVNLDVLMMLLREKGYFSYAEIDYAILEPSGNLSILPSQESQSVSKKDLAYGPDLSSKGGGPFTEIVVDGEVDKENLQRLGYDEKWLMEKLLQVGAQSLADLTYLAVNEEGQIIADTHRQNE